MRQLPAERGDALKQRLRTRTVVFYDDRNWELRWSQERRRIKLARAIAVDMESGTQAAQGYRLREARSKAGEQCRLGVRCGEGDTHAAWLSERRRMPGNRFELRAAALSGARSMVV